MKFLILLLALIFVATFVQADVESHESSDLIGHGRLNLGATSRLVRRVLAPGEGNTSKIGGDDNSKEESGDCADDDCY